MKFKHVIATFALSTLLGIGALFGAKAAQTKEVKAAVGDDNYYLTGILDGAAENWGDAVALLETAEYLGVKTNQHFAEGDTFKIKAKGSWEGALTVSAFLQEGAYKNFGWKAGDDNIHCYIPGTYNVYVNSELKIKFELVSLDKEVTVYGQVHGWDNIYAYTFDTTTYSDGEYVNTVEALGAWPGTKLSDMTLSSNFNANLGGVAKIVIPSGNTTLANTKLILHNGEGTQSGNQPVVDGYYYWKDGNLGDGTYGAQAKVVYDMEAAIMAATNKSVCAISVAKATELLAEYDALSASGRVDISTIYTWDKVVDDEKANHTYAEVVAQLRAIVGGSGSPSRMTTPNNSHTTLIIVITSVAVISGLALILVLRKKKQFIK